ncbi:hypothetical protein [Enterococcus sp. DIV1420a]|uniref:hypothetical protein n=1 Tax=Enterococcus sp. DIV1420a TaxID=2774672 RepID=UPI003F1F2CBF
MTLITILAAFGGGIFGALISGTISFIFTGIVALLGFALALTVDNQMVLSQIAFGSFFGPQVAFVGAVAATAYAGRKNKMAGFDVNTPLFVTKDVGSLLVGGIFGVLGFVTNHFLSQFGLGIDSIAITVVLYGLVTRFLIAGDGLVAKYEDGKKWSDGFLDTILFDSVWALGLSLVVGFVVITTGLANFGWAISAVSLIFLFTTVKGFPVSHHVTMVAGYAAITFGNIYMAALFGVLAVIMGDFFVRTTNTNVKSHLDMPAVVIAILGFIILTFFG